MRLWSIHPQYLDSKGLVALWREALLAQKVLLEETRGYRNHPQLIRFKQTSNPAGAMASYLRIVYVEAVSRGYNFDNSKIINKRIHNKLHVTNGQAEYEFNHLLKKLKIRSPEQYLILKNKTLIRAHPLFKKVRGGIEGWETI